MILWSAYLWCCFKDIKIWNVSHVSITTALMSSGSKKWNHNASLASLRKNFYVNRIPGRYKNATRSFICRQVDQYWRKSILCCVSVWNKSYVIPDEVTWMSRRPFYILGCFISILIPVKSPVSGEDTSLSWMKPLNFKMTASGSHSKAMSDTEGLTRCLSLELSHVVLSLILSHIFLSWPTVSIRWQKSIILLLSYRHLPNSLCCCHCKEVKKGRKTWQG